SFIGIIVGHLYFFLDKVYPATNGGQRLLNTPQWLKNLVPDAVPKGATRGEGPGNPNSSKGGSSSSWGRGNRLGTD
ncbi:hypothetical protein HK099_001201, partial [Clydaea vesicula]